jgi:glucosamine 6-phosphate synthetase-like amidotransferase/phosphosugar isomerase protein
VGTSWHAGFLVAEYVLKNLQESQLLNTLESDIEPIINSVIAISIRETVDTMAAITKKRCFCIWGL